MKFLFSAVHGQLFMPHVHGVRNWYFSHFIGRILVYREIINMSVQAGGYLQWTQLEFSGVGAGRLVSR